MLNAATATLANVHDPPANNCSANSLLISDRPVLALALYTSLSTPLALQMGGTSEEKVKRTMQQYYTAVTLSVKNILQAAEFLNASTAVEEVEVLRGIFTFVLVTRRLMMHFYFYLFFYFYLSARASTRASQAGLDARSRSG